MKRREFIRKAAIIGGATAGGLLLPSKSFGLEDQIKGIITNTLSGEGVEGARVIINGKEYITDSKGFYNIIPVGVEYNLWRDIKLLYDGKKPELAEKLIARKAALNSGIVRIDIEHEDYNDAVRYHNLANGNVFSSDIINKSFDMNTFNGTCRPFGATQRWREQPKWYLNTNLTNSEKINLVKEIINNDLVNWTRGFINNSYIKEGTNPPDYSADGWVIIEWKNVPNEGVHGELLNGNQIYNGAIRFNLSEPKRRTYLHELTQVLGARGEIQNYNFIENGDYTKKGLDIGKILYSRPIGSKSPDIDPEP